MTHGTIPCCERNKWGGCNLFCIVWQRPILNSSEWNRNLFRVSWNLANKKAKRKSNTIKWIAKTNCFLRVLSGGFVCSRHKPSFGPSSLCFGDKKLTEEHKNRLDVLTILTPRNIFFQLKTSPSFGIQTHPQWTQKYRLTEFFLAHSEINRPLVSPLKFSWVRVGVAKRSKVLIFLKLLVFQNTSRPSDTRNAFEIEKVKTDEQEKFSAKIKRLWSHDSTKSFIPSVFRRSTVLYIHPPKPRLKTAKSSSTRGCSGCVPQEHVCFLCTSLRLPITDEFLCNEAKHLPATDSPQLRTSVRTVLSPLGFRTSEVISTWSLILFHGLCTVISTGIGHLRNAMKELEWQPGAENFTSAFSHCTEFERDERTNTTLVWLSVLPCCRILVPLSCKFANKSFHLTPNWSLTQIYFASLPQHGYAANLVGSRCTAWRKVIHPDHCWRLTRKPRTALLIKPG